METTYFTWVPVAVKLFFFHRGPRETKLFRLRRPDGPSENVEKKKSVKICRRTLWPLSTSAARRCNRIQWTRRMSIDNYDYGTINKTEFKFTKREHQKKEKKKTLKFGFIFTRSSVSCIDEHVESHASSSCRHNRWL